MCRPTKTNKAMDKSKPKSKTEAKSIAKMIIDNELFPLRKNATMFGGTKMAQIFLTLYCLVGVYLFTTGTLPMMNASVNFLSNKLAMTFAAWKFASVFYMLLTNLKVPLNISNSIYCVLCIAIDVLAVTRDSGSWTPLAWSIVALDSVVLLLSMGHNFITAAVLNGVYGFFGIWIFATSTLPFLASPASTFEQVWAGWRFCGCLYFTLVNLGLSTTITVFVTMVFYLGVDMVAVDDLYSWKNSGWGSSNWFFAIHGAVTAYHQWSMLMEASQMSCEKSKVQREALKKLRAATKDEDDEKLKPKSKDL